MGKIDPMEYHIKLGIQMIMMMMVLVMDVVAVVAVVVVGLMVVIGLVQADEPVVVAIVAAVVQENFQMMGLGIQNVDGDHVDDDDDDGGGSGDGDDDGQRNVMVVAVP